MLAPRRGANNFTVNDAFGPPVIYSDSTSGLGATFPIIDVLGPMGAGYYSVNTNSDYTIAALTGNKLRLVGAGLRTRYTGTELNRSGICHAVVEPTHASLSGLTLSQVSNYDGYFRSPVQKKWTVLTYNPEYDDELEFLPDATEVGLGAEVLAMSYHYMGFLYTGLQAGSTVEFEAVLLLELSGRNIRGQTRSTSDMVGTQAILNQLTPQTQRELNVKGPAAIAAHVSTEAPSMMSTISSAVSGAIDFAQNNPFIVKAAEAALNLI
jgi:hypothetical protein